VSTPQRGRLPVIVPFHIREILGHRLRLLRTANDLTQQDVVERVDVSSGGLSELETGQEPNPRLGLILVLLELYDAPSLEQFFSSVTFRAALRR
jgi:transcriptional regulator with XRE-family HTH domain